MSADKDKTMRRRSILKWIALTAISLTAVCTLSTIVHDAASAAIKRQQSPTQGSLQVLDKDGKPAGECPLKHTEVKAQVSGFISRVTVTQDFENNLPNKIEAVYTFPLPEAAAVDDLTMVIGERTIKGKIMRREEAKNAYAAAKQMGKVASLLDQERPNIFTQQVANILPGERIRVRLSYVETLKYEDGSYEWLFPMVVAERYMPVVDEQPDSGTSVNTDNRIRDGHDVSLEIDVDAGMPILSVNSATHETDVQKIDESHAVVRLKDRATIPNKDFVMTYRVAGDSINDAVLAHRSERGGFFTLILQPPLRVAPEDVMPKELVFVLDTSGSMSGFPIEKAKETMDLALNTLYPHDTFNLITFSGDTEILFPQPVPATPENLRKAKKFLASRHGEGGTEMMKAIKAALDPSDSQYHVRLACFMTDGQVGNDEEIIAEVQKHTNARVFAMGFGDAPNRYLLDRMSQYGRGEVNYVAEDGNSSAAAQRFNDRVRSPLLTDISIDWGNLPVRDVYPKRIPDLFSAKPLIVSGRYDQGGKGTIRLKGKLAGEEFVREIPVELPETEAGHDVLSTLWARRRIDDLMGDEIANYLNKPVQDQAREEITQLGLDYKLMTKYTSFVAIDDTIFTGTDEPQRVDIVEVVQSGQSLSCSVTVSGSNTVSCSVGSLTVTGLQPLKNLPLEGRSVLGLMVLAPGTVATNTTGMYSVNGQRPTSNRFKVDGVSADFGIAPGGENPGPSAAGNTPALTASGGANGVATLAATQEFRIQTLPLRAEFGASGSQVEVVTDSGTNTFHGSLFHFFGNYALDANNWFANSRHLKKPAHRLNFFGGTFEGPIRKDHTFFFASYEGMRLRQPMVGITDVPSLTSRTAAPAEMRPFLNAFPVPNGASRTDGFAEFASSFTNPARHDVGSLKIEHMLNNNVRVLGSYSFADSDARQRGAGGLSLNTTNRIHTHSQTFTGVFTDSLSTNTIVDLRVNYSRLRVDGSYVLDEFGGTALPATSFPASFTFDLNSTNAAWKIGNEQSNLQRQFNLPGSVVTLNGAHTITFGGDYRRLSPVIAFRPSEENAFFDGVTQATTGIAARVNTLRFGDPQNPVFNKLSLFGQDEWRQSKRLILTYVVRWDLAPAPSTGQAFAVDQISDPATLKVTASGNPLWETRFLNFGPRAGVAYLATNENGPELVLRGGASIVYDVGQDRSGEIFAGSIPFVSGSVAFNSPFPVSLLPTTNSAVPLLAFDPRLKLPYLITWNASVQQYVGTYQSISATYIGSSGKRLLHTETLFNENPDFSFLRLTTNRGHSDYRALQVTFERDSHAGFTALASYTWSRSMDNVMEDSARRVVMTSADPQADRGPSDFDVRHQLTGYAAYELPAPVARGFGNKLLRNWALESIFNARSGRPLNVVYLVPTSFGVAYLRPDVLSSVPRLRGFQFYQVDLALRRKFHFTEYVGLQIQADAFNVFNRANFMDPPLGFEQSTSTSGARTMRVSVRFLF